MKVKDITKVIEEIAPLNYQESYDNAGLLVGNRDQEVKGVLITLDVTEAIVDEAISKGRDLIIAHHPLIFRGLKRLNGNSDIERSIIKALKNDIAIYAAHTNLDNVPNGVNDILARKLQLKNTRILSPIQGDLFKLVCFVPKDKLNEVQTACFKAGAGQIGNYDSCSFNAEGTGTFRAGENADPYVGEIGQLHKEDEIRFETLVSKNKLSKVIQSMINAHPYEEVAYDVFKLENENKYVGAGLIGEVEPVEEMKFLLDLKKTLNAGCIKHTKLFGKKISKVAVCGGSGSFLLREAISAGADIFISGDFKYHEFFDAENKIIIADPGHYESEQFTKELFYELLKKNFPNFATDLATTGTNPVQYL